MAVLVVDLDAAEQVPLFASNSQAGSQIKAVLEVTGHLRSQAGQKVRKHPLKVLGHFLYEERLLDDQGRCLRYYEQAEADLKIDGKASSRTIRDELRWILVDPTNVDRLYHSPTGPLTRQELDLIAIPGASNLADRLLPNKKCAVGDTWHHDNELIARLLSLEAVTGNDVTSELMAVDANVARIRLSGKVVGSVQNVVTDIELSGKYNFELTEQRVNWLTISIGEKREIGASTPGLDVTARLRMVIGTKQPMSFVTPESVNQYRQDLEHAGMLEYSSTSEKFAVLHDRRWSVFYETPTLTVLRCVEDDRMIAQCNIRVLPSQGPGKSLEMNRFQQEIHEALSDSSGRIVDAQQSQNAKGYDVLRVVAVGIADNAPVQWIYYHLTHPQGDRVSLVFTMSASDADRFAGEDLVFTGSLSMRN